MKRIQRILPLLLVLALTLSACAKKETESSLTPEKRAEKYAAAITAARSDEENEYLTIYTNTSDADPMEIEMIFAMLGFSPEDAEAYAVSISLMNINAYGIAAVKPAEGKEETVKTGLENFIESQKAAFERYLEDQHEIAASAKLESLDDGTLLLVMCEGQDAVFDSIKTALS